MAKKAAQTLANKRAYHIVSIALAHWRDLTVTEQKQHGGNMPHMDFSEYEAMAHEVVRLARDFRRKSEGWDESTEDPAPAMREELTLDYAAYVAASDEPEPVTIESTIACMDYATAHQMWDNANRMFWSGQMEQKHYELICAAAKARMAELEAAQ